MPATFSNKYNLSNAYHLKFKVMKNWKSAFFTFKQVGNFWKNVISVFNFVQC